MNLYNAKRKLSVRLIPSSSQSAPSPADRNVTFHLMRHVAIPLHYNTRLAGVLSNVSRLHHILNERETVSSPHLIIIFYMGRRKEAGNKRVRP